MILSYWVHRNAGNASEFIHHHYFNMTTELILLKQAVAEINRLRRNNQLMAVRLQVFDSMVAMFEGSPRNQQGSQMSPDLVYDIEKWIALQQAEPIKGTTT